MKAGAFLLYRTVGAGHVRPGGSLLSHANGLDCRGGIYAARDACADGNSAGRIYAAPTNLPANGFSPLCRGPGMPGPYREAVRRGGIYAARAACADGNSAGRIYAAPTTLPANGFLPLCRGPGMPGPYCAKINRASPQPWNRCSSPAGRWGSGCSSNFRARSPTGPRRPGCGWRCRSQRHRPTGWPGRGR